MDILEKLARRSFITETGCFEWLGGRSGNAYGQAYVGGRAEYVHRLAWAAHHGWLPPGAFVLHRCDNPPCWNEAHLRLGTPAENANDMISRGRAIHPLGRRPAWAKLTTEQVIEIRTRLAVGESGASLGREYGVSRAVVSSIKTKRCYASA